MSDVIVLFSGGVDSLVLAADALSSGRLHSLMTFDYPHPAMPHEHRASAEWVRRQRVAGREIEHRRVPLPLLGSEEAMRIGIGAEGPRIVPGRNLAMLAIAVNHAAAQGAREVWIGATAEDRGYPDCCPSFIELQRQCAEVWGVTIRAPLLHLTRQQVLARADKLGADLGVAWSCYEPRDGAPCGECNSCRQGAA